MISLDKLSQTDRNPESDTSVGGDFASSEKENNVINPIPSTERSGVFPPFRQAEQVKHREKCYKYVQSGLNRNVTVKFLMEKLIGMGCKPPEGFINCKNCGDKLAGGGFGIVEEVALVSQPDALISSTKNEKEDAHETRRRFGDETNKCNQNFQNLKDKIDAQNRGLTKLRLLPEIFLCQEHLVNEQHAHQSIVHELIHAIDLCRTNMDPINNCVHMACTEIRAENLSGECDWTREIINGRVVNFRGHGAECVKRRSILSVKANPNCTDRASDYVDAAFAKCFKDTYPFDRHPNLR